MNLMTNYFLARAVVFRWVLVDPSPFIVAKHFLPTVKTGGWGGLSKKWGRPPRVSPANSTVGLWTRFS